VGFGQAAARPVGQAAIEIGLDQRRLALQDDGKAGACLGPRTESMVRDATPQASFDVIRAKLERLSKIQNRSAVLAAIAVGLAAIDVRLGAIR